MKKNWLKNKQTNKQTKKKSGCVKKKNIIEQENMSYHNYNVNIHYSMFLCNKKLYKNKSLKNPKALKTC